MKTDQIEDFISTLRARLISAVSVGVEIEYGSTRTGFSGDGRLAVSVMPNGTQTITIEINGGATDF